MRHTALSLAAVLLLALLSLGTAQAAASVVHGNVKSRIYHNAACKYFTCKACTAVFATAAAARAQGYRACKVCGG